MVKYESAIDLTNAIYHSIMSFSKSVPDNSLSSTSIRSKLSRINSAQSNVDEIRLEISFSGSSMDYFVDGSSPDATVVIRVENVPRDDRLRTEVFVIVTRATEENFNEGSFIMKYKELEPIFTIKNETYHKIDWGKDIIVQYKILDVRFNIYNSSDYRRDGTDKITVDDIAKKVELRIPSILDILNRTKPLKEKSLF